MSQDDDKPSRPMTAAELARDLAVYFDERRRVYAARAEEFGYARDTFSALSKTLDAVDQSSLNATNLPLESFNRLVRKREGQLDNLLFDVSSASYAVSTTSANAVNVSYFETAGKWIKDLPPLVPPPRWSKDRVEVYAQKLDGLDPELGRIARSVWQLFYGGSDSAERSGLFAMRQLYDHFFALLASDDAVSSSSYFKPKGGDKPQQVHRRERLAFAAATHIQDPELRELLLRDVDRVLETYDGLNRAHARRPLLRSVVEQTLTAMQAVIEQWVDAIEAQPPDNRAND